MGLNYWAEIWGRENYSCILILLCNLQTFSLSQHDNFSNPTIVTLANTKPWWFIIQGWSNYCKVNFFFDSDRKVISLYKRPGKLTWGSSMPVTGQCGPCRRPTVSPAPGPPSPLTALALTTSNLTPSLTTPQWSARGLQMFARKGDTLPYQVNLGDQW